jgi:hypothetical protein
MRAVVAILAMALGCSQERADPAAPAPSAAPASPVSVATAPSAAVPPVASSAPVALAPTASAAPAGPRTACPSEMAFVPDPGVCVQRWEAQLLRSDGSVHDPYKVPPTPADMVGMTVRSKKGVVPQGYVGRDQAEAACSNTVRDGYHYRLCTKEEWQSACRGPAKKVFPYGTNYRVDGKCNTHKFPGDEHLVKRFYPEPKWSTSEMNDPRINQVAGGLAKTGEYAGCTNAYGLFDMVGNVQEWVSTLMPKGKGPEVAVAMGDHYMGQGKNFEGCDARDAAHPYVPDAFEKNQRDYSRGIRCCADPQ